MIKSRLLVADDNIENLRIWELTLNSKKYDIDYADNGLDASKMFTNKKYDLVLLDIQMPKMDGFETAQFMKTLTPTCPIWAITGSCESIKDRKEALLFDRIVTKPFEVKKTIAAIESRINI